MTQDPAEPAADPEAPRAEAPGLVVTLRLEETVTARGLELRWVELADSRCPADVQCIWEGEAVVTLEVGGDGLETTRIELGLRPGGTSEPLALAGHLLRLLSVEPYPGADRGAEHSEQVATLELRAAGSG